MLPQCTRDRHARRARAKLAFRRKSEQGDNGAHDTSCCCLDHLCGGDLESKSTFALQARYDPLGAPALNLSIGG
jgi:hypothetical protein